MAVVATTEAAAVPAVVLALWRGEAANRMATKVEAATVAAACYVLSTLVLIFRYMSRSIMVSSILSSDQLNFIERLESVNRVFRPT